MFSKFFEKLNNNKKLLVVFFTGVFVVGFSATYLTLKLSKMFVKNTSATSSGSFSKVSPEPIDESKKGIFNVVLLDTEG